MEHTDTRKAVLWNTLNRELSVLVAVIHTHPTIPNMFIPSQRLIRPPGCIYVHKNHCWMGPRMMNNNKLEFGYCFAKLVNSRKCPPAPRMCSLCMNYCIMKNRNRLEASKQCEPDCGVLVCIHILPQFY